MRHTVLSIFISFYSLYAGAQSVHVGVFGGISNYQGDLVNKRFVRHASKGAGGVFAAYEIAEHWTARGGLTFTKLTGDDKYNTKLNLQARNLSFSTSVTELSAAVEYATFNLDEKRWTPYLFGGIALFHFNPYTSDAAGKKVFLKPLSTEGQGLTGYSVKPYALTQLALPFGGGFRFALTENVRLGLELGIRKLFTDNLDDVSGNYAGAADLLRERSPEAVAYAYRGDEVAGGNRTYPEKGTQRGGALQKDWYYLTGMTVSFRLGADEPRSGMRGKRSKYGCPASPL